jgi:hypothetical protein
MDTDANLEIVLTIPKAIFLHSPDCEFAEVGAKSDIPYKNWFNLFKEFLMKNATKSNIEDLFKWWNGKVFSFDTKIQGVKADDVESGMDEAELFLADDFQVSNSEMVSQRENNNNEDDFIGTFNNLTIDMHDNSNQPLSSHTASSSEPRLDSEIIILQPDKSVTQNPVGKLKPPSAQKAGGRKGKGKQKAVFMEEADLEAEELVETEGPCTANERNLRSRRK